MNSRCPTTVRLTPLGELVEPRGLELRAAQAFGIFRREGFGDRPLAPFESAARGNPGRPVGAAMHREDSRLALDHDVARVAFSLADQRDALDRRLGEAFFAERNALHP